ncbi:MAG: glycosyltransferase family 2 protein [Candidatus Omnitrophica bacterium]|nr:glycosyltransferase family 2 protein [Candidatus Omnitrophota bacterium]MDD5236329.1 glycosyltransferase family 2 protein [Candidatus Omnitrophota bacterium]MDD5610417.1 glycosyltransferase family 2 protein [Candidatus Omnitrophota bacterium]
MAKETVSVNIVNWNGLPHITGCLDSVFTQDYKGDIRVIVVDNGSSDGSCELISEKYPQAKILKKEKNLGFSMAHNEGIRAADSDYCLLLNFDIILEKNFISEMVSAINKKSDIGMVSGKLYKLVNGKPTNIIDSTGIEMPFYFSAPIGELKEDQGQFDQEGYVFGPCGAAPLYKKKMLEDIKIGDEYFDEDFINYVEDVDLAWRAQLKGWKCLYTPRAKAYHIRGITRSNNNWTRNDYYRSGYRNRYWAMYKNVTRAEFKRNFFKIMLKETVFLLTDKEGACSRKVILLAAWDAYRGRQKMHHKRLAIQKTIAVSGKYIGSFFKFDELNTWAYAKYLLKESLRRRYAYIKHSILRLLYFVLNYFRRVYHLFKRAVRLPVRLAISLLSYAEERIE